MAGQKTRAAGTVMNGFCTHNHSPAVVTARLWEASSSQFSLWNQQGLFLTDFRGKWSKNNHNIFQIVKYKLIP